VIGKFFQKKKKMTLFFRLSYGIIFSTAFVCVYFASAQAQSQNASASVELNGDTIEYVMEGNKVIADGNVEVIKEAMTLTCDRVEFSKDTGVAYATGHVRLVSTKGESIEMTGEALTFNFEKMTGTLDNSSIFSAPYFGFGEKVSKVDESHMEMKKAFITTCDLDKPHYRMTSKKMDVYPGDKLIARSVRMLIGNIPMLYLPRFTQDLREKKPKVIFTPGYDKEWGMFVLSQWRYHFNENFKGIVHVDAREKKDIAWGVDVDYKTPKTGSGKIKTYYMNERSITSDHFWQERPSPTIEKERFKAEWRHKWKVDDRTEAILQYYKLSDNTILKDYFEKEFEKDSAPSTFALITRTMPSGTLSFRTDARVNRFQTLVERLPELRYDLTSKQLFNSKFYIRNVTTYSNLTRKHASPSEVRENTMRLDTDNELSRPMKIGFIEFRPFVGGRNTYYSKTKDPEDYNSIRGIFRTGASLSTRFYRVFDVKVEEYGLDIHRLRHIITPSVSYEFANEPTLESSQIDSFDSIDNLDNIHSLSLSLENKLQTKRNATSVDLLRFVLGTNFHLKEHPGKGGFGSVSTDIDFTPADWIKFYFDSTYDTQKERLETANFDIYINGGNKWSFDVGKRWNREVDDQLTTSYSYVINPKWAFRTYTRFDLRNGILKEQEYTLSRDLHAWEMDINFNETRKKGNEIWIVFTLKAFPDMVIDFGTSFNRRKAGSQSSEGDS